MNNVTEILLGKFRGKKTYITSIATALIAVATYFLGQTSLLETIELVIAAAFGSTFRSAFAVFSDKVLDKTNAIKENTEA